MGNHARSDKRRTGYQPVLDGATTGMQPVAIDGKAILGDIDDENRDFRRGWKDGLPLDRQPEKERSLP